VGIKNLGIVNKEIGIELKGGYGKKIRRKKFKKKARQHSLYN
jgi:hypothetical protein